MSSNSLRPRCRASLRRNVATALLAVGCFWPGGTEVAAQALQFRQLTPDDGLASSWVRTIYQDSRGYMWIGTGNGLNRYDGSRFTLFEYQRDDPHSIADNYINAIYEDRSGTLWIGHSAGLSRLVRERDSFANYEIDSSLLGGTVISILEDSHGNFWLGTSNGVYAFDRESGRSTPYRPGFGATRGDVRVLIEDRRGRVWAGSNSFGLLELDPVTGASRRFLHDPADPNSLPEQDIRAIIEDPDGNLWLGMNRRGLAKLDPRTGGITRFSHDARDPRSLGNDNILHLFADGSRGFWVATEGAGLNFYEYATGAFSRYRSDPDDPTAINSNSVWAMHRDASGVLWVGTFSGGINISKVNSAAIRHFRTRPGDPYSLGFNSVVGFAEDRAGAIWVATDGGGLNRFDRATGRFTRFNTTNTNLLSDAVLSVLADRRGDVWITSWGGGVSRFDRQRRRFTHYTAASGALPEDNIFSIFEDRAGRLWVGSWTHGLGLLDRARGVFDFVSVVAAGLEDREILFIRETRDGKLLLGMRERGLVIFDPETGGKRTYRTDPEDSNSLSANDVFAAIEGEPGTIWVGTASGLDRLDVRTQTFRHYSKKDGLPSSSIRGLAFDGSGHLWVSTSKGVSRFDPVSESFENFAVADGLQGSEFNPRANYRTRGGTILFGGTNGFNTIEPEKIVRNVRRPPVVFTGFQLFNRPVPIGEPGSPLQAHIGESDHLVLTHRQSVFTIEFAALDFIAPDKNEYAYRMEGFDADWSYVGHQRTATYTNLPPGEYVFRVKASNNDGVWNEAGASLRITIVPAFWQTWWFRALILLALTGVLALITRSDRKRRRKVEAMNAKLAEAAERDRRGQRYLERNVLDILAGMERFSAGDHTVALEVGTDDAIGKLRRGFNTVVADRKRTEDNLRQSQKMEAVGRLAGGVAHDFNNMLTAIAGHAQLMENDLPPDSPLQADVQEIKKAAERSSSLTRQLLAFSRKQILQPRAVNLNTVVEGMEPMVRRMIGEDVEVRAVLSPDLRAVFADPGQLEQVILNLVINARDAMPAGGRLTIETREAELTASDTSAHKLELRPGPHAVLAVSDSGEGMDAQTQARVFEPFFTTKEIGKGTGLGLATVYGIVKQSGGYIWVYSEPGHGSTFKIYLPLAPADPAEDAATPALHPPVEHGHETVLVVEDEASVRKLVGRVLRRSGYTVLESDSGRAAAALVARYRDPIHLLLTDVVMPAMSGRAVADLVLERHPGTRVLFMSGYTDDTIVHHGVLDPGTEFIEKPFTTETLLRRVQEVLDGVTTAQA
jgi:signal transduction histidine kinase/ligand-binding sensor domain-containing protein/CheY-like chemotaxis protein